MPPSSLPSCLPFDILHHIFLQLQVLSLEEKGEYSHGGRLIGWDSNETLRSLPLVCRSWEEPAIAALYHSISLHEVRAATRLLTTFEARPELAELVRKVAVGVREVEASPSSLNHRLETSEIIIDVLNKLPNVEHVLIRQLHSSVRPQLLDFLTSRTRRLKSLVLVARDVPGAPQWGQLLQYQDVALLANGLQRLDVDIWNTSADRKSSLASSHPRPLRLTHLCLDSDCPPSFTYSLICDTLINLRLYFETVRAPQEAADALAKAINLQHLDYVSNPPVDLLERQYNRRTRPVLDLVLSSLPLLETVHVSATDISPHFLFSLPANLYRVSIQAYSPYGFEEPELLLDLLRRPSVDTKGLRDLQIKDSSERWEELKQPLMSVCARRGIRFNLVTSESSDE